MRGLASPHPVLGAISWTFSTSPSVLAVLFGVSRARFGNLFWFSTGRWASVPEVHSVLLFCGT